MPIACNAVAYRRIRRTIESPGTAVQNEKICYNLFAGRKQHEAHIDITLRVTLLQLPVAV